MPVKPHKQNLYRMNYDKGNYTIIIKQLNIYSEDFATFIITL